MDTENKEINLPENIKEEIRKNVAELKEILKEDSEYAETLIRTMFNTPTTYSVSSDVYGHYPDIIKKCQEERKAFPVEIQRLYKIVSFLTHLATGEAQVLYDVTGYINDNGDNYDIISNKLEILAELCVQEIGFQFNPNITYRYETSSIFEKYYDYYEKYCTGENSDLDSDL